MPLLVAIYEALVGLGALVVRAFFLLRGLFAPIVALIKAYWPKIIAALPAIFYFLIDRLFEAFYDVITDAFDTFTHKIEDAPQIPFPTITTLAEQLGNSDPLLVEYLQALRVVEGLSIIGTVAVWRYGKDIVMKVLGKLFF